MYSKFSPLFFLQWAEVKEQPQAIISDEIRQSCGTFWGNPERRLPNSSRWKRGAPAYVDDYTAAPQTQGGKITIIKSKHDYSSWGQPDIRPPSRFYLETPAFVDDYHGIET